jgi:hypothetical protein
MNSIKDQATREPLPHHLPCQNREMGDCVGVPGVEEKNKHSRVTPTGGAVLRDGTFLELVRNPQNGAEGVLLHRARRDDTIAGEVSYKGCNYMPSDGARSIRHLPSTPEPYGTTAALFNRLVEFIAKFSGMDEEESALLAFFSLSSYFFDCFTMSPSLLLFGEPLVGISLLRILACVCRHSVLSVASSTSALPPELHPTHLIGQMDGRVKRQLVGFQFPGFSVLNAQPRQLSGASVIYTGDSEPNSPFAENCLRLWVSPANRSFGLWEEEPEAAAITRLQNQLLMYRLENYSKVKTCRFTVPDFCGITGEHARTLGRCIVDTPELQARVTALLRTRNEAEQTESAGKLDAVVVEGLLVCCHERKGSVHVGEVAILVNAILTRDGEEVDLSARQVGGRMKRLGFRTVRLDAGGRGIYLLNGECARIHQLARAFRAAAVRQPLPGCPHCNKG